MEIPVFSYFMSQYRDLLQMSLTENIELFCESESAISKMELLKEVEMILNNLNLEDWEMDTSVMLLCNKYSKRTIKVIAQTIKRDLTEF